MCSRRLYSIVLGKVIKVLKRQVSVFIRTQGPPTRPPWGQISFCPIGFHCLQTITGPSLLLLLFFFLCLINEHTLVTTTKGFIALLAESYEWTLKNLPTRLTIGKKPPPYSFNHSLKTFFFWTYLWNPLLSRCTFIHK